jgi:SAM-dependent methyltransferase
MEVTPRQAIEAMQATFPLPDYTGRSTHAYLTVATTIVRYVPRGSSILDFGCGPGDKTAVASLLGYRCTGYDELMDEWHQRNGNRDRILEFARSQGITYVIARPGPLPFAPQSFDMVMSHDVLEHLHDSPRDLFNQLIESLRDGGYLFVTVPNAGNIRKRIDLLRGATNLPDFRCFYWMPGPWRGHVREYVRNDLVQLCTYLGLAQRELRTCHHMVQKKRWPWIIKQTYKAATLMFPDWRDSWLLVAQKPAGWRRNEHGPSSDELAAIYPQ